MAEPGMTIGQPVLDVECVHGYVRWICAKAESRLAEHGIANAGRFGVCGYVEGRFQLMRCRRSQPSWAQAWCASPAPSSRWLLGAVRDATAGFAAEQSPATPCTHARWTSSHTEDRADRRWVGTALPEPVLEAPEAASPVGSGCSSGWAPRPARGNPRVKAVAAAVPGAPGCGGGGRRRRPFLPAAGHRVAATRHGTSHFCGQADAGVVVASESLDDKPGWHPLPRWLVVQWSVVQDGRDGVHVSRLRG